MEGHQLGRIGSQAARWLLPPCIEYSSVSRLSLLLLKQSGVLSVPDALIDGLFYGTFALRACLSRPTVSRSGNEHIQHMGLHNGGYKRWEGLRVMSGNRAMGIHTGLRKWMGERGTTGHLLYREEDIII